VDEQMLANLRAAIGLVTASQVGEGGHELASLVGEPIPPSAVDIMAGLVSLCGLLLVRLGQATGVSEQDLLRQIAARYANP
jgi:hypothetical protein